VNTLHVVKQVVCPRESIICTRTVTVLEMAKIGLVSMSMESMGFTFVPQKTSCRRETIVVTVLVLATEWLDVRVNVFAMAGVSACS
jgi:hypothetical protein